MTRFERYVAIGDSTAEGLDDPDGRGGYRGWANRLERFAATYACRSAVKGGTPLDEREMRRLLHRLFRTSLPAHDVHGRATIVQLPREELERRFGRR